MDGAVVVDGARNNPEQSKDGGPCVPLRDVTNDPGAPDEKGAEGASGHGPRFLRRDKGEIARERWGMLAKALLEPRRASSPSARLGGSSVRRFRAFGLFRIESLRKAEEANAERNARWLEYSSNILGTTYRMVVRHVDRKLTPEELAGYNNTGNICVWPSEEVLAFHLLSNLDSFEGKRILEVGGGMTCLAGLLLATYGKGCRVDLTDGNTTSVNNVQTILKENRVEESKARAFQLDWTSRETLADVYDIVLSSDCLFFDDSRSHLVDTIWRSLKVGGMAIIMAPKRGSTVASFVALARRQGFVCSLTHRYDETVWRKHQNFKAFNFETDYWVSQGRKFCEFCKCSIADNKPSIQFHENGRKHRENVAKRLTEMQKKASKEAKDALNFDKELKRIESAALKAYANDVKCNGDYTSQLILAGSETLPTLPEPEPESVKKAANCRNARSLPPKPQRGGTVRESLGRGSPATADPARCKADSSNSKAHRKKRKSKLANDGAGEAEAAIPFPTPSSNPYGTWKKVEIKDVSPVDLQLPKQDVVQIAVPKLKDEHGKEFREKVLKPELTFTGTENGEEEIVFKKRKISPDARKNMRQRSTDY